jgi:hypothetical protein
MHKRSTLLLGLTATLFWCTLMLMNDVNRELAHDEPSSTSTLRYDDCDSILSGVPTNSINDEQVSHDLHRMTCAEFMHAYLFDTYTPTTDEVHAPVAYSISTHRNISQILRLIRMLYTPQNVRRSLRHEMSTSGHLGVLVCS